MSAEQNDQLTGLGVSVLRTPTFCPPIDMAAYPNAYSNRLLPTLEEQKDFLALIKDSYIRRTEQMVEPVLHTVREFSPDVMIVNLHNYSAQIAVEILNIPYLGVSPQLMMFAPPTLKLRFRDAFLKLWNERESIFRRYGLSPSFIDIESLSPYQNVCFTTKAFVGIDKVIPTNLELVGPAVGDVEDKESANFPWSEVDEKYVLVAMGSFFPVMRPDLYKIFIDIAKDIDYQMIIGAGQLADVLSLDLPKNVLIHHYVPQIPLLKRASLFISHCGAASVSEAIYHGVPIMGIPLDVDQLVQAHFIEERGIGRCLNADRTNQEEVSQTLRFMLTHIKEYRSRLRPVQSEYVSSHGTERTVRLAEDLAKQRP